MFSCYTFAHSPDLRGATVSASIALRSVFGGPRLKSAAAYLGCMHGQTAAACRIFRRETSSQNFLDSSKDS